MSNRTAHNTINREGEKHSHWTIGEYKYTNKDRRRVYVCTCDCGTERIKSIQPILLGKSISCGCVNAINHTTHGLANKRVYKIWKGMKDRCLNPKSDKYKWYGGRGITVCKDWVDSFESFYSHMGEPPSDKHSIDRIGVNGNYEPGNCRWATHKEQCGNRRNSIKNQPLPQPPQSQTKA